MTTAVLMLSLLSSPDLIERIERDLTKVKHTIEVTQQLLKRSRGAHFEADMHLRLAELYVEQSRYEFYLVHEQNPDKKDITAPKSRVLKEKAIETYQRILAEWPDHQENDKVLFFMAHEYRELGRLDEMVERYRELIRKHPKSKLLPDAHLVLGDYFFAKKDMDESRRCYQAILDAGAPQLADTANFKLGWTHLNGEPNYKEALRYFEAAVKSDLSFNHDLPRAEQQKLINVKHEAMTDLAYTYTEVYQPKDAIPYFRSLAQSRAMYLMGLRKLADRYYIKEKLAPAAEVYRELLQLSRDTEVNLDLHARLYEAIKKEKSFAKVDADVRSMLDTLDAHRYDWRVPQKDRSEAEIDFELMARDLATQAQEAAQKSKDKELYRKVAFAYSRYLSSFPRSAHQLAILANLGDSLFEAGMFIEAGDRYVSAWAAATEKKDLKAAEEASYSACAAFFEALKHQRQLTRLDRIWALEGLKQNGLRYVEAFPKSDKIPEIRFNIARSYYEAGELERAVGLFDEFVAAYPGHKSSVTAAELLLDAYGQLQDYEKLAAKARALAQIGPLGDRSFKERLIALAGSADERQIGTIILTSELEEFWQENQGSNIAEKVLYSAFVQHKETEGFEAAFETGHQFIGAYPKSQYLVDVFGTLSSFSLQVGDFEKATGYLEELHRRFPDDPKARGMLAKSGTIKKLIGDHQGAIDIFKRLGREHASELMEAYQELGRSNEAVRVAKEILAKDPEHAKANLVVGLFAQKSGDAGAALESFQEVVRANGDPKDSARAAFEIGEILHEQFKALGDGEEAARARAELLPKLEAAFVEAARFNQGEWAVAALHRVGMAYAELARSLEGAPLPAGLSSAEEEEYRALLGEQVATFQKSSAEYFDTCVAKARELPVLTGAVLGCVARGPEQAVPPLNPPAGRPDSARQAELRSKLMKSPRDQRAIAELADWFLSAGQPAKAKLMISRGLELEESNAMLHNKLGMAELLLGNPQAAYFSFRRASELKHPYAGANLATLMITFKDKAGAKKAVSKLELKDAPAAAADLHPAAAAALKELL